VVLEHSGWESREDPAAVRGEYDQGWPTVLDFYAAAAASSVLTQADSG
jgi:hypothetical protein